MSLKTAGKLALNKPQFGTNPDLAAALETLDAAISGSKNLADYSANGAIAEKEGVVTISKAGVAAMTIADPTSGTDDGKILRIVSKTANAHTVTFTTALNGGANHKATYGGAIGDTLVIQAIGGKWYFLPSVNQTLSAS